MLNCLNCEATLVPGQVYCDRCGQKVGHPGLTLHEIGHDLMHALAHVDRSVATLLRALLLRPGYVSREYVDGRRKRYFGPFGFLTVAAALSSAAVALAHFSVVEFSNGDVGQFAEFLRTHLNLLILLQVPVLAGVCRLFFSGSGTNFAENMVLTAYTSGIRSIFFAVVFIPFWFLFHGDKRLLPAVLAIWALYFGFAAAQFYARHRGRDWIKGMVATITSEVIASIFLTVVANAVLAWKAH